MPRFQHCVGIMFSPRMWRCFYFACGEYGDKTVFSTHVEMFPPQDDTLEDGTSFLHACGDVSGLPEEAGGRGRFSPRMWRCFFIDGYQRRGFLVFSTHVEMFLPRELLLRPRVSFLHACGDVSERRLSKEAAYLFSPRMWRCFRNAQKLEGIYKVFSTHVEMFPIQRCFFNFDTCFLHACGDVSDEAAGSEGNEGFSPRMWRCFFDFIFFRCVYTVFSTHVEMFPKIIKLSIIIVRFLHACGDVSIFLDNG